MNETVSPITPHTHTQSAGKETPMVTTMLCKATKNLHQCLDTQAGTPHLKDTFRLVRPVVWAW